MTTTKPTSTRRSKRGSGPASAAMCPTCEGREPLPGEEAYAACVLCLTAADDQQERLPLAS